MSRTPLISLRGITRLYGEGAALVKALAGIDLDIGEGEFVAVMGPSGCGKSTAMNILGCLDRPTSGTYAFMGTDITGLDNDGRALFRRNYLGFVFQGFNLLARTTALENVELPLTYRGTPRAERQSRAREALALVGLQGREDHPPSALSGGQQQRVAIARAIVSGPKVLLADEPTGNLDSTRSHDIMKLIKALNEDSGITVIMVTHEKDMAAYARRQLHFNDGLIISEEKV
ncbi:MAG: ABC transporter ATP-binding protein [Alphaproteobacteria bacterium]|nr:ABC transporter ATP-binding protein [Alphaproteobacteria bacterium]